MGHTTPQILPAPTCITPRQLMGELSAPTCVTPRELSAPLSVTPRQLAREPQKHGPTLEHARSASATQLARKPNVSPNIVFDNLEFPKVRGWVAGQVQARETELWKSASLGKLSRQPLSSSVATRDTLEVMHVGRRNPCTTTGNNWASGITPA